MRANSPISDADPFSTVVNTPKPAKPKPTDLERLANSDEYPAVMAYLEGRKDFYRKYMPDGEMLPKLSDDEAGRWWKCAATIINEVEAFQNMLRAGKK